MSCSCHASNIISAERIHSNFKNIIDRLKIVENNVRVIQEEWTEFKRSNSNLDNISDFNSTSTMSETQECK